MKRPWIKCRSNTVNKKNKDKWVNLRCSNSEYKIGNKRRLNECDFHRKWKGLKLFSLCPHKHKIHLVKSWLVVPYVITSNKLRTPTIELWKTTGIYESKTYGEQWGGKVNRSHLLDRSRLLSPLKSFRDYRAITNAVFPYSNRWIR